MDGILIIDKPAGFTSHDVVAKCRKILRTKKIGHTGTLDPFATGVLVILVGKATRLAQFLDKAEKEYEATVCFGFETDTGDFTGSPKFDIRNPKSLSSDEIEKVLPFFRGEIEQIPPMYSAKKIEGKKLYELARKGIEIERKPIKVTISELSLIGRADSPTRRHIYSENKVDSPNSAEISLLTPRFGLKIVCSAGTYIRTLAEDIGRKIGIGAHLIELRRTRAGGFSLEKSATLEELAGLAEKGKVEEILISMNDSLPHLPKVTLNKKEIRRIANGQALELNQNTSESFADVQTIRLCDESETLLAIGYFEASKRLIKPKIVFQESNKNPFSG